MNKRFSTLMAAALVAGGLSANAQQPDGALVYDSFDGVKDGTRVQLTTKAEAAPTVFGVASAAGKQKLNKLVLSNSSNGANVDSTHYESLKSILWTVNVKVNATGRSYSFTSLEGAKLIVPSVTNAKDGDNGIISATDLTLVTTGIGEWNYSSTKKCFYAFNNDSVFYLAAASAGEGVELHAVKGDSEADLEEVSAPFQARYPQASLTLNAEDFNKVLEKSGGKFFFHQSSVKNAPITNNAGDNILTAKTWKAYQANVKTTKDSIPAKGQKSWGEAGKGLGMLFPHIANADSLLVLWSTADNKALVVDTAYLAGTTADTAMVVGDVKMRMPAWKLALADTVPTFGVNPSLAGQTLDNGKGKFNRPIGSVAFVVKIDVATDSISIRPYNLPKFTDKAVVGGTTVKAFADSLIADFTMQEGGHKMVAGDFTVPTPALRVLGTSVYLAMDTVAAGGNTFYPLIKPYDKEPVIGGDADINVEKVYFLKLAAHNFNAGSKTDADYTGQYLYAPLTKAALTDAVSAASDLVITKTANVEDNASQWIAIKGNMDGNYSILNRSTKFALHAGAIKKIEKIGTKTVTDTYLIGGDTIQLVDAKATIVAKGEKDHAGYLYVDANKLANKSYQITSTFEYLADRYMQGDKESVSLMGEENAMYLEAVGDNKEYGAKSDAIPALYRSTYKIKDANGKYVKVSGKVEANAVKKYVMADEGSVFYIKACAKDQYVLVDTAAYLAGGKADDYDPATSAYWMVSLNAQAKAPTLEGKVFGEGIATFSFTEMESPSVLFKGMGHKSIKFGDDMLAIGKDNNAVAARVGDLKAAYESGDFTFYLDSVNYKEDEKASYYISKAIAAPTADQEDFRMYLTLADADSVKANKEAYTYADGSTRYVFRPAMRYGVDSLIVLNTKLNDDKELETVRDTITLKDNKDAVNGFRFQLQTVPGEENSYLVVTDGGAFVQKIGSENSLVATAKAAASVASFMVKDAPVGNETIDAATIKVVAGEGNVTVYGAAGKKVVVSDVLGKNTTVIATSDSQVIPASQGVAIIAVEGEAAVKAVVK